MSFADGRSSAAAVADVVVLDVLLHDRRVGTITRLPNETNVFVFDKAYAQDDRRPTLSLSFKGVHGGLVTDVKPARVKLPTFFSNLLPEGKLRAYIAEAERIDDAREFFLLRRLGEDLPGAVKVRPSAGHGLGGDKTDRPDADADASGNDALKFSLAGVQLKFSAVEDARGGLTIPAHGVGGFWIVKLPSTHYPAVPENELAMMSLAKAAGMDVPDVRLVPVGMIAGLPKGLENITGRAVAVRRFDRRPDGTRVHAEDFAQVFGLYPEEKYKKASYRNIAEVIYAEAGEASLLELVRRLVFCALIGNGDMHVKNWSLLYPDARRAVLAPAYDLVATVPYIAHDKMALSVTGIKEFDRFSPNLLTRFAAKARLPETMVLRAASETVERTIEAWNGLPEADVLPREIRAEIEKHIEKVARNFAA